ncbi:apolipoprotein N-acyltransferase [Plantibacter sp. YIM 135347]|uniref:apolipoprotein N-acyltransferase n=1 Tax=Plantibacter sp. YIM 135347 TaxID=3423919 RepID=UPI003D3402F3
MAIAAGPILDGGFPDRGVWPLAFVGIGLILLTLMGRSVWGALLIGFIAGESFYLVHIEWATVYLGPVPWAALATVESIFFALGAILITLAYRFVPRAFPGTAGRVWLTAAVVAAVWTARESLVSVWPYGGFPWARMALSQSESPFAPLVAWVGFSGLSFIMVLLVALSMQLAAAADVRVMTKVGTAVLAVIAVLIVPSWPTPSTGSSRVAAVQGNGPAGYFDGAAPGTVMNTQIEETLKIIDEPVDMVVWPEGSADLDPQRVPQSAAALDYLSRRMNAPFIVGAISNRGDEYFNSSLLWSYPDGVKDIYDKKHPVPFGEYVPDRAFWEPLSPDLIGLIQRDYTPGTKDNVFDIGGVLTGISICFDIADDQLTRDAVADGARMILAQTNNADFGTTDENEQQLAIARLRAIESARSVVNISTVGTSQIIGPDGHTITSIPAFKPGSMVADVPLTDTVTPAMAFGHQFELFIDGMGLATLVLAGFASTRPKRKRA